MKHMRLVIMLLSALVILGALIRLNNLDKRTISHIEIWVPNIKLPYDLSDPRPRLTLLKTLTGPIAAEPHPPAYYALMFGWTKVFGTSPLALRLPSVVCGALSIILIYSLCSLTEDKLTGLFAAGMLAFNGLSIYWSQEAKFYSMACFMGLLSTALLALILDRKGRQVVLQILYIGVTLIGLATVIYFWPIFLTQMLWILTSNWRKTKSVPRVLRSQIFVFILGSPLWALAAYQSRRPSYLDENLLEQLGHFFQFGFLFEPDPFLEVSRSPLPLVATISLVMVASILFVAGLVQKTKRGDPKTLTWGPSSVLMTVAGVIIFICILVFAKLAHAKDPSRTTLIAATSSLPFLLLLLDFLLKRYWGRVRISRNLARERGPLLSQASSMNTLLGILPVGMIAGLSLLTPLFAARAVLLFIPYFIIILSRGLASLVRRNSLWIMLAALLIFTHAFSVAHWQERLHSYRDYKGLFEQWAPKIRATDLIVVQRHWALTPIFYYLNKDHYRLIGQKDVKEMSKSGASRVWVLSVGGLPRNPHLEDALLEFRAQERVEALNIWTDLYVVK